MDPLIWSIVLLLGGIGLIFLELFIPSGGVLSFLAALSVVASVIVAFTAGFGTGLTMMVISAIVVPVFVGLAIHWWPRTSMGREVVLTPPKSGDDVLPDMDGRLELKSVIGRRGIARGKMLPSGPVIVDDRTYDAVSEGTAIEAGQIVRVTAVNMNRLVVRIDDSIPRDVESENVLDRPADSLGLDTLDGIADL